MIIEIPTDPFTFLWPREEAGYEWAEGTGAELRLVGRGASGSELYLYEPLAINGLFLEFAKLNPSKGAILLFANRYGDLFDRCAPEDVAVRGGVMKTTTSFEQWKREIGDMNTLVRIWEATTGRNTKELQTIIKWVSPRGIKYSIRTPKGRWGAWLTASKSVKDRRSRFGPMDVLWTARYALQAEINRRIGDPRFLSMGDGPAIIPRLEWTWDRRPDREERERYQRIILTPSNLLAAMWLQFARAIAGEYRLKTCQGCGGYFQSGPGGKRPQAVTCNDACRQRASRKRRQHSAARLL